MKKTLLLILTLSGSLLVCGFALAQSSAKIEANQTRRVKGQVLTSIYLPSIRVRFEKSFKYIGSQKFILYNRARVEQVFFVDADNQQRIKRMYMMQFEGYLPNINATTIILLQKLLVLAGKRIS
jgi:hypothetical protein